MGAGCFAMLFGGGLPEMLVGALGGLLYLAGAVTLVVNVWMTIAGKIRAEKPMTETPYDPVADRPLVAVPAE